MKQTFLVHNDIVYTYENLLDDLNNKEIYSTYIYVQDNNPYEIFLSIIHSLLYDYPIEILDGDFSEKEIDELGLNVGNVLMTSKITESSHFLHFDEVMQQIQAIEKWHLTLYTSGTTGRPKKVSHTFHSFTRNVKKHNKLENDVWAFAYNPTHMAGLQVFFQALLNQNTLIYIFGESLKNVPTLIKKYQVTNISATPTFYRNVLPYLQDDIYSIIKRVTFGGEKFDAALVVKLNSIFPNAKITNVYASTEAGSLFAARGDEFEIKAEYQQLIKTSAENELCIHYSLLGASLHEQQKNEWFHTGDLVEMVDQNHFKFLSRQSDMINVGGYKVNPFEVEDLLIQVPGVNDILVKSKKNSVTGELIVADVVKDSKIDGKELKIAIKKFAVAHLQEWKVPRIIKFVDELPCTRTGKKVRK
ncbi:class I adenylate-forming enzyme family protein [Psychrobacillus psychrodurans]|uniref:class I adenylate-forming enzyme family protein n=1 Tax=Psychrobacillus psychrodurans TaxID=126157 RepID=UPI000B885CB8|nr:class I adenylate-forming enzyme family protein [Psychrobacillus psychrodurans]MCZ8539213.1 acyl--CoA ligase [Psychrobacillus psychrodurans]